MEDRPVLDLDDGIVPALKARAGAARAAAESERRFMVFPLVPQRSSCPGPRAASTGCVVALEVRDHIAMAFEYVLHV